MAIEENVLIHALAQAHPNYYLWIHWNGLVRAHPDELRSDGIHPSIREQRKVANCSGLALSTCL